MERYDLIIIGGGPAGLTAAVYAARRRLKTLVLIKEIGGQAAKTNEIENYPGFERIAGFELMEKMKNQAAEWGARIFAEEAREIVKDKNGFKVVGKKEYSASALILSFGMEARKLKIKDEEKFVGRGITYCATCDGPLFKDKIVAVVGGGNAAMEAAEYMAKLAKQVFVIHHSDEFRAEPELISQVRAYKNVKFICFSNITAAQGEKKLSSVTIENSQNGKKEELSLDGLF
ncbi:MAG: FAD-dependent oxidoreductase, partial [Patescibacteria group bacterium]